MRAESKTSKNTMISFFMDEETNELLTIAANKSQRSKRAEVTLRIKDHLIRFSTIAQITEMKGQKGQGES